MLKSFSQNLWISDQELKVFSVELGARMTVVDYTGRGDLWVHSPIKMTDELIAEIKQRGTVRTVVAPNKWHHLYIADFHEHFPEARYLCAPELDKKKKNFKFDEVIDNQKEYPWSQSIDYCFIEGATIVNEVVFLHKESKTLIVTDLCLHICKNSPFLTRVVFKAMGMFNRFGWSNLEKKIFISDKEKFYRSIDKILQWDFERVVLAHGVPIEANGKSLFSSAFKN